MHRLRPVLAALLIALLPVGAATAGSEARDAVSNFKKRFAAGLSPARRETAVEELAQVADAGIVPAFEHALGVTVGEILKLMIAKDEAARGFYVRDGFHALVDDVRHLYISLKTVRKALG